MAHCMLRNALSAVKAPIEKEFLGNATLDDGPGSHPHSSLLS